jgi:hypothetical protein
MSEKPEDTESEIADSADVKAAEEANEASGEPINMQELEPAEELQADSADIDTAEETGKADVEPVKTLEKKSAEKKKGSRTILVLLITAAVLLGVLAANGQLQPLYYSFTSWIASLSARPPVIPPQPGLPTSVDMQHMLKKIDSMQLELKQMAKAQKQLPPPQPDNTVEKLRVELSEVTKTLDSLRNDSIANLSAELNQVAEAQKALRSSLQEQQQMNLQLRLRWITDPASRLPQIKLAWEEISLMDGLSGEQRVKAEEMHVLARNAVQELRQWRASMQKWADTLAVPLHKDILPKTNYPWLDWAIGQFHLRPAPTEEARQLIRLKNELKNVISQLAAETWPAKNDWQQLRAQLVLQARSRQIGHSTEPVEPDLPSSFETIKTDINTLQQTAQQWLEHS